jgi:hypothetical protein
MIMTNEENAILGSTAYPDTHGDTPGHDGEAGAVAPPDPCMAKHHRAGFALWLHFPQFLVDNGV